MKKRSRLFSRVGLTVLLLALTVNSLVSCRSTAPILAPGSYYTQADVQNILEYGDYVSQPRISEALLDKYPEEEFLYKNECMSFYRDMDYFIGSNMQSPLSYAVDTYPPQIVRTINSHGTRSLYLVYETDQGTRVFMFYYESNGYTYLRGYPIVMKDTLYMQDFSTLAVGDRMERVEEIDPITSLYKKGYDRVTDAAFEVYYIKGDESISTVHLLKDGIIRINYERVTYGEYYITQIIRSEDFVIPVLGGELCYRIYDDDYVQDKW